VALGFAGGAMITTAPKVEQTGSKGWRRLHRQ
jgi:hypothetical protein